MAEDIELLRQRVVKHQQKLEQVSASVEFTRTRVDTAAKARDEAVRERERVQSALALAKSRAARLAKDAKKSRKLADALSQDHADAENEFEEFSRADEKRRGKLARAESALAAAEAIDDKPSRAKRTAATGTRAEVATKAIAKKATAKRATAKRATAKKAAPTKRAAPTGALKTGTAAKRTSGSRASARSSGPAQK